MPEVQPSVGCRAETSTQVSGHCPRHHLSPLMTSTGLPASAYPSHRLTWLPAPTPLHFRLRTGEKANEVMSPGQPSSREQAASQREALLDLFNSHPVAKGLLAQTVSQREKEKADDEIKRHFISRTEADTHDSRTCLFLVASPPSYPVLSLCLWCSHTGQGHSSQGNTGSLAAILGHLTQKSRIWKGSGEGKTPGRCPRGH